MAARSASTTPAANVKFAQGVKGGQAFTYLTRLEYDKFEQRRYLAYGNGATTQYAYDARNRRLANLQAVTQGRAIQNLAYRYDKVGNILGLDNKVPVPPPNLMGGPTTQSFGYDDLHRLTKASGAWDYAPNKRERYSLGMAYDSRRRRCPIATERKSAAGQKRPQLESLSREPSQCPVAGTACRRRAGPARRTWRCVATSSSG